MDHQNSLVVLSRTLLFKVKLDKAITDEEKQLQSVSTSELMKQLKTDDAKKTFWINIYNAYFQILSDSVNPKEKTIFTDKSILIAQNHFSLGDIEHGILRKRRWKWTFGYLPNPFVSKLVKQLSVEDIDYRIHFALNCGAKSCPPIAFYSLEYIDKELDEAMRTFIISETTVQAQDKIVYTSKLLYWYLADFGGFTGVRKVLKQVLRRDFSNYQLIFNEYNWENQLHNFISD